MAVVDELVAILGYETRGEDKLRSFTKSIDDVARRLTLFAAAAATAAAGAATLLAKSVINTSAQFESYAATLETIEGSAEKARKSLDWVAEFGKTTPYEVGEVTNAFVRLKAYGLDPMDGTLSAVGDAASAMGKGLMQGVEAVADAATGEFERLKEFGIKSKQAGDSVTFTWSQNGKELTKTVKKSSTEIVNFLKENFGARFNGAMVRQSKTWNGMISNIGDSWTDFHRRIGDAGFFDAVKNQLGRAMDYIGGLDADGTLDRWAGNLSWAFTKAANAIADFVERGGRHLRTIGRLIEENKGAWEWLKWALAAIALRLFPVTFLVGGLALAIEDLLQWMGGGKSVIGDFVAALEAFTGIDIGKISTIVGVLASMAGLAFAAGGIGLFTLSLSPLTKALLAFSAAYVVAKEGFEFLKGLKGDLDGKISATKAVETPKSKPGYVESGGYDKDGKFIYMDGNRRTDRPAVNPQSGFTDDALDYKLMLQNLEGNAARMGGSNSAASVNQTVSDTRDQSVTVNVGGVVVNGTGNVNAQVGGAVGQAVGSAAAGAGRASRFEKDDAF